MEDPGKYPVFPDHLNRVQTLKTDPAVFRMSWEGKKSYEVRYNDRDFAEGDVLLLRETVSSGEEMKAGKPLVYTGRVIIGRVVGILYGPVYGLMNGWVILTLGDTQADAKCSYERAMFDALHW